MVWHNPRSKPKNKPQKKKPLFYSRDWQRFYEQWLLSLRGRRNSDSTPRVYGLYVCAFFRIGGPSKLPNQYTQDEVLLFLNQPCVRGPRKGQPPSASTHNQRLKALDSFYRRASRYAVSNKRGSHSLMRGLIPTEGINMSEEPVVPRAWTEGEIRAFFAAIPHGTSSGLRDRAMFLCYLTTGRRSREIRNLTWGDIHVEHEFADGVSGVRYEWLGKGRVTKTSRELPQEAWQAIKNYLEFDDRWGKLRDEDRIFVAHDSQAQYRLQAGEQPGLSQYTTLKRFHRYCRLAGLAHKQGLHDFRWTQAQWTFRETNNNILAVAEKLDHTIQSSQRYLLESGVKSDPVARKLHGLYAAL